MEPLTFERVTRNPELIEAIVAQARRERAAAVYRLIIEPIQRLFRGHVTASPPTPLRIRGCSRTVS